MHIVYWTIQRCDGKVNATHMLCLAPALPGDSSEEKTETGHISFDMDGARGLWNKRFDYHPDAAPIPFENEKHILVLNPGVNEVSLHVCVHNTHPAQGKPLPFHTTQSYL